jgi:hypothetical protein
MRRRLLRASLAGCVVATVLIGVHPASAAPTLRVALARLTRIIGTGTGTIDVSVPERVTISAKETLHDSAGPNRDIRFAGQSNGIVRGFALVEDPYPEVRREGRFLMSGQFATCDEPPCDVAHTYNYVMSTGFEDGKAVVEPGDYTLVVISDGGPVDISLTLRGLTGRTTVRPARGDAAAVSSPELTFREAGPTQVWSGGETVYGGQVGFSVSVVAGDARKFEGGEFGVCQYNAADPPPDEIAYGPHCQAAVAALGSGASFAFDATGEDEEIVLTTSFGYNANENTVGTPNLNGQHGLGVWAKVKSKLADLRIASVFVAIDSFQ